MSEKISLFAKLQIFFGEVRTEMSKVVWPTREQTRLYSIVVIVSTAAVSLATGVWDLGLSFLVKLVFGIGS